MSILEVFARSSWDIPAAPPERDRAVEALEHGRVLYLPELAFPVEDAERPLFAVEWKSSRTKNLSFDAEAGQVRNTGVEPATGTLLAGLMGRYAKRSRVLVEALLPGYAAGLRYGLTSFRPAEIEGRALSARKDDRLLHPDAFPSRPMGDRRILRVFTNVDPHGRPRVWEVGEPFERFATAFLPRVRAPLPGLDRLNAGLGLTKGRRSRYDHLMLQLHDRCKADTDWQRSSPRETLSFPPGSTWIVFTDQVLHAALSGCHALEQTFHLPVSAQLFPDLSPLRVLERLIGRPCV